MLILTNSSDVESHQDAGRVINFVAEGFYSKNLNPEEYLEKLLSTGECGLCVELHTQKSHCEQEL